MTPPDQSDQQPSALSRLERALAGFGDQTRTEPEPEPGLDDGVEVDDEVAFEPDREREADSGLDAAEEPDDDEPAWDDQPRVTASSSSILDIASAVEAVERLSATRTGEPDAADEDEFAARPLSDADEFVLAATAARSDADDDDDGELPRFAPADLRRRIKEFEDEDEAADTLAVGVDEGSDLEPVPESTLESDEPASPRVSDAADSWQRDIGDTRLPYFLVEDNVPLAAEPTPVLEELRQATPETKPTGSIVRTLAEIPILLVVAAVIAFLVKTFLAQAYYIPSGSMLPQLRVDDRVVVSKLAYKLHDPRRGDIVVFDDPRPGASDGDDDEDILRKIGEGIGIVQPSTDEFIKRVIGLPGDTVEGKNGHVYVNGRELIEPYLADDVVTSDFAKQTVRANHLWVMGDNRSGSADSRVFGQIDVDTIVGRAVITVWPFGHVEFL